MELDQTDFRIIDLLQKDARLMNKQVAAEVGLAASSCHERIKRLWAMGVFKESRTIVDPTKLGFNLSVVVKAKITKQGQVNIDSLMDRLMATPEIQHVLLVTGHYGLVILLIVRDMNHLKDVARRAFSDTDDISDYETAITYETRSDLSVPLPIADT